MPQGLPEIGNAKTKESKKACELAFKNTVSSIKKGRFWIETAKVENFQGFKKNKVQMNESEIDTESLLSIIAKQNTQIELLFDMIRNITGRDKLFEREFISEMTGTYELINEFKKKINLKQAK